MAPREPHLAAIAMAKVYYQAFCPLGSECSKGGRQLCCSETREEAFEKLAWHLHSSSYHQMELEDAQKLADNDNCIVEFQYDPDAEEQKPKKRRRSAPGTSSAGDGQSSSAAGSAGSGGQLVQHGVQHRGGGGGGQLQLRPRMKSPPGSPPPVRMRVGQVQHIVDALNRATKASEHAAQISRSAATAFEDQAATLRQAQNLLQDLTANRR